MTDEVMFEICALTGQEYVNRYADKSDDDGSELREVARPTQVADAAVSADGELQRQLVGVAS